MCNKYIKVDLDIVVKILSEDNEDWRGESSLFEDKEDFFEDSDNDSDNMDDWEALGLCDFGEVEEDDCGSWSEMSYNRFNKDKIIYGQ